MKLNAFSKSPSRPSCLFAVSAGCLIGAVALFALFLERNSSWALRLAYDTVAAHDAWKSTLTDAEIGDIVYAARGEPSYSRLYESPRLARNQLTTIGVLASQNRGRPPRLAILRSRVCDEATALSNISSRPASSTFLTKLMPVMVAHRDTLRERNNEEHNTVRGALATCTLRLESGLSALAVTAAVALCCVLFGTALIRRNVAQRQRIEEGLRLSERRFEILCEQAPIGIYETDAQGLCVYTNSQWTRMSGLSTTESLGHGWTKALHPDDRATVFKGWQEAAQRGTSWEYRLIAPGGTIRWIRALGGPIRSAHGNLTGYVGTMEDVTDRKRAATVLLEREALNRAVLNSLPAQIAVLNADGAIQTTNDIWKNSPFRNADAPACFAVPGANYLDLCKEAAARGSPDAGAALVGIQNVLNGKLPSFQMQYQLNSNSDKCWFRMLATPLAGLSSGGAVLAHVDITARKQAEERFRLVFDAAPSALIVVGYDGKIMLVNSETEKLFGYDGKELHHQDIELLVADASREKHPSLRSAYLRHAVPRAMAAGMNPRGKRKDGSEFPVEVRLNPIEAADVNWILVSIVDITEKRRADRALHENRQELQVLAARLMNAQHEERKRISRQLHDDLSQKLALLAFDTQSFALAAPLSPGEARAALRELNARIVQLSDDVRQIAHHLHPSVLEDLGLMAALRELCDECSASERVKIVFVQDAVPEELPVEAAACIYGVAQEALHNILKHAHATRVTVVASTGHSGVNISIHDNGRGFNPESAVSRQGLGIISMKERVRQAEGEFLIHSEPGHGTTISVFVPFADELV